MSVSVIFLVLRNIFSSSTFKILTLLFFISALVYGVKTFYSWSYNLGVQATEAFYQEKTRQAEMRHLEDIVKKNESLRKLNESFQAQKQQYEELVKNRETQIKSLENRVRNYAKNNVGNTHLDAEWLQIYKDSLPKN